MVRKSLICANNILILATVHLVVSERVRNFQTENQTAKKTNLIHTPNFANLSLTRAYDDYVQSSDVFQPT